MIGNYVSVGVHHLLAQKLYSAINILGLAVGLACAILVFLYVRYEVSFDERFQNADRIYRISADVATTTSAAAGAANVQPAAALLKLDFPQEIEETARIWGRRVRLRSGAVTFYEDEFRWADSSFFAIFALEWLAGDPQRALAAPSTVVLTESTAAKYFGRESPLGQTLLLENEWPLTVTGVVRDLPGDTHLSASAFASMDTGWNVLGFDYAGNWSFRNFHTYALLAPGARIESIESRFEDFVARHRRPGDYATGMTATKITDIHLNGRAAELRPPGSKTSVAALSALALSILLIACVNFMNLSTARAAQRAREVGVRKALGAQRKVLIAQFLGEATLYVVMAMLLAIMLVELLLSPFNAFVGTRLAFDYLGDPWVTAALVALALLVGAVAGSYPAFYLSAFEPAKVLKGDATRGAAGANLRAGLVVLQFAISIVLLIVTGGIYRQTEYARNVDRGFDTEQMVVLSGSAAAGLGPSFAALRERLLEHPEISDVLVGSLRPGSGGTRTVRYEGGSPEGREIPTAGVDYGFFEAHGIELVAGRTFSEERGTDAFVLPGGPGRRTTGAYMLSELAARELGWTPAEAIDKWFETDFAGDFSSSVRGPVIGVVKDIFTSSAREPLRPVVYFAARDSWAGAGAPYFTDATVRITGNRIAETVAYIDAAWAELAPDMPLVRSFLDDRFAALYRNEERQATMLGAFSLLAVFVACLGLVGLASFATERRIKEIGIRKAIGGGVIDIVVLFCGEFGRLVLVANLVAWPVAYLAMQRWLAGFAYRADLSLGVFVGSAAFAFMFAAVTVGAVAARAASVKPVRALRYE